LIQLAHQQMPIKFCL